MPICATGTKHRLRDNRSKNEISVEIKARITIEILAARLFPNWNPKEGYSPFRTDRNPGSFSIYWKNGVQKWKDHATDDGGDLFDFFRKARDCDQKTAFLELKAMLDGGSVSTAVPIAASTANRPEKEKRQFNPKLEKPTDEELTKIYHLRSIWTPALRIAVDRGLLWCSILKDWRAFMITDKTRRAYNARRMDGKPWDHLPSRPKAQLLYGSEGDWPIGIYEAEPFPAIALCEGAPDFLAAFGHAYGHEVEDRVAPVMMSGASVSIRAEALPLFKGKRVRIFVHDDRQGHEAAARWKQQLTKYASKVDRFAFDGLTDHEGSAITDLNQLLTIDYDSWESNKQVIEAIMDFAREK